MLNWVHSIIFNHLCVCVCVCVCVMSFFSPVYVVKLLHVMIIYGTGMSEECGGLAEDPTSSLVSPNRTGKLLPS